MLAFFRFIKFYNEGEITMVSVRKRGKVYEYRFEIAKETAKRTAQGVKVAVKATVSAIKAILAGTKALVAAIVAGGWVAVIVIMVDPASNQTDMWSAYEWSKSSQFNYFKAE